MGFQVAPMIDIVFVILLFFMVAAGNARRETALDSELPGEFQEDHQAAVELPDEIEIMIDAEGGVQLNEELMDEAGSEGLPLLKQELRALKKAAGNDLNNLSILLKPDETVNTSGSSMYWMCSRRRKSTRCRSSRLRGSESRHHFCGDDLDRHRRIRIVE